MHKTNIIKYSKTIKIPNRFVKLTCIAVDRKVYEKLIALNFILHMMEAIACELHSNFE